MLALRAQADKHTDTLAFALPLADSRWERSQLVLRWFSSISKYCRWFIYVDLLL